MTLLLNGKRHSVDAAELLLPDLLKELGFGEVPVLVEHNGEALRPREHAERRLQDGDRLEIIQIVAGG